MTADDDERAGILALDPLRQAHGAVALRGEVALQADDVRRELLAEREAVLFAVDAQVDDLALVSLGFETGGDADRAERLDEGEHLQAEDAADRRFEERDFHGVEAVRASEPRLFLLQLREHQLGDGLQGIEHAGAVHRHGLERRLALEVELAVHLVGGQRGGQVALVELQDVRDRLQVVALLLEVLVEVARATRRSPPCALPASRRRRRRRRRPSGSACARRRRRPGRGRCRGGSGS